jgi:hypothetical protein
MLVSALIDSVSLHIHDPSGREVTRPQHLIFVNDAARDLTNAGWLLPIQHAENIELLNDEFEYDVPAGFAYVKELRLGDQTQGNASALDTGVNTDEALDDSETEVDVGDASIFVVNDLIQIDSEIMLVTARDISSTQNTLTVTRGYFSTTEATHDNASDVERPLADTDYDYVIPRAYWRLKLQTGGRNTTTAALGSRPQFVFNSDFVSFTPGTPVQVIGQARPTVYTAETDTLDLGMESFLRERALTFASRFASMGGSAVANMRRAIGQEALALSEQFLRLHPQEFRVAPNSTRIQGR